MKVQVWILAAVVTALAACGNPGTPMDQRAARGRAASGDIVVAAAWPWKKRANLLYGQGLDLALDAINGVGGINGRQLQVLREDDNETVDQGRETAQKLSVNPDVVAVIGHLQSYITVPAAAIYDNAGVVLVSPAATDPALTEQGYKLVFRTTFTDKQVGSHMAKVATAHGYRRLAIYYMRDRYGRSLANAFEETFTASGGLVIDRQSYDPSAGANPRQIDQLVDDWKGRDLAAIFVAGEAPQAALLIAAARSRGLTIPVLGGDALGTPELFAGDAPVDGVTLVSSFHPDDPRPEVRAFNEAFQARFGRRPDSAAAIGYDSLRVLAEGLRRAASMAPADIAAGLRSVSGWRGVTRTFSFSASGDLIEHPLVTVVARKGRFVFLSNGEDTATGPNDQ